MGVLMGWLRHPGTANDHHMLMLMPMPKDDQKTATTTSDHAHADADAGAGADAVADAVADANADADADDIALRSVIALAHTVSTVLNLIADWLRSSGA